MSSVAQRPPVKNGNGQQGALANTSWEFVPFMCKEKIKLTIGIVKSYVANPTKSGKLPSDREVVKFIQLCKARGLNPFEGDAFLVGYDSKDGPSFSLITAHQAFLKRAEVHPEFDGIRSGAIVTDRDGNICERKGSFILDDDMLVGGWATVYFKGRTHPVEKTVKFRTYNTGRSRWEKDPAGMIVKVAEAAALRTAFPSQLGGMYLEGEFDDEVIEAESRAVDSSAANQSLDALADQHAADNKREPDADGIDPEPEDRDPFAWCKTAADVESVYQEIRSTQGGDPAEPGTDELETARVQALARVKGKK